MSERALIVGAGAGLSASLARLFKAEGMEIALASRAPDKTEALAGEIDAVSLPCDVADIDSVQALFDALDAGFGTPDLVVFNPSARVRGPVTALDPAAVQQALMVTCFGGFLVAQEAAKRMIPRGAGAILFTGASAAVKGYPNSSSFAMGKFGLRGLCQSLARELHPQNIHIGHFIIDGGIGRDDGNGADDRLSPDAIAESYLHLYRQHRSAWTWEVELRPWVERF